MCKIAKELLAVSKTPILEQLHSSISFVFRLWDGERKNSYVFKVFSRKDSKADFAEIEDRLSHYELNHSLLSTFSLYLENTRFFCFEGLHQITRQKAKQCFKPLVHGVRTAIEELHKYDMAHLDIRLPNLCFRKYEGNCTVLLIDLERAKHGIDTPWCGDCNSCMYKKDDTLNQIDYRQLYWMSIWILSYPAVLDYHHMDCETTFKDVDDNNCRTICIAISEFIKCLPTTFHENDWEAFLGIIKDTLDDTLFSCV